MLYSPLHPICVTVALRSHVCRVAAGETLNMPCPGGRREKFGHAARVHSGAADTVDRESAPSAVWTESHSQAAEATTRPACGQMCGESRVRAAETSMILVTAES